MYNINGNTNRGHKYVYNINGNTNRVHKYMYNINGNTNTGRDSCKYLNIGGLICGLLTSLKK